MLTYLCLVVVHPSCVFVHDYKVEGEEGSRHFKRTLPPVLATRGIGQTGAPGEMQAAGAVEAEAAAAAAAAEACHRLSARCRCTPSAL
jgi:hypothetical protein